jgi:2-oxoisovalerate dehydrogenase E1 component
LDSVKKTGRAIVLHEDCMIGGFGADLSAMISDECFEYLDAPVKRSASMDTPVPFANELEDEFLAKARFETQLKDLLSY